MATYTFLRRSIVEQIVEPHLPHTGLLLKQLLNSGTMTLQVHFLQTG
jgi:hypothetical protein